MLPYTEYTGSKENKNLHITHLEDMVLEGGVTGTRNAIMFLQSLRDMLAGHSKTSRINLTVKFDGAPAIFTGINPENGRFFVGTKGVFNKDPKLNYTDTDIDKNHTGEGLNYKLKIALRYLRDLDIRGVIQGDMMFTKNELKQEKIDNLDYVTFRPNTITYAVPDNTTLASQIKNAQMGIVWHTSYHGPTMMDMRASPGVDIGNMRPTRHVWYRDASFVDASGTATFTKDETDRLNVILAQAGSLFKNISARTLNEIATNRNYSLQLKAWNNLKVREGTEINNTSQHIQDFISFMEEKLNTSINDAKKQDTKHRRQMEKRVVLGFYRANRNELKKIIDLQNLIVRAKLMIVRKLEQVKSIGTFMKTDDGFRVVNHEGFVAVDSLGSGMVKFVDRLSFSHNNFNTAKNWTNE